MHAPELIKLYHKHSPLDSIKGRRLQSRVQCPPGLTYPPLLGVAKKAGPRLLQPSSIPPYPAPASQPLSSTPNRQTTNHRPENRPLYLNSSPAQLSPSPMSCYDLNTPRTYTSSSFIFKTNYLSKLTDNTPLNIGTSAGSTTAHTTTTLAATRTCQPHLPTHSCPSNHPKKGPPRSIHPPSPLPSNNSVPLWLRRHPSPFHHDLPRHALTSLTGSQLTCSDPSSEAWWPPSERGTLSGSPNKTSNDLIFKSSKIVSKKNLRYHTTCILAPMALKPTMTDVPPMPTSPTKMDTWCRQNGYDTSKMGTLPPMPWGPRLTQCRTLWTYTPNPPSMTKTSLSNQCPSGFAPLYTPTKPTGKYFIRKFTKWQIGASPLKSSDIGTCIGSLTGWPRRSSSCRWT